MHRIPTRRRGLAVAVAVLSLALVVTACSPRNSNSEPESTASQEAITDPAAALETAYTGIVGTPPTESVPSDVSGTAWIVSCGESVTSCSSPSEGAREAAETVGWSPTVCDGKVNPDGWTACVRQGVAARASVILTIGFDCASVAGALTEAKAAGVPVVGVGATDCEAAQNGPLFSAVTTKLDGYTNPEWWTLMGQLQAKWLVGKTDGQAKVLSVDFKDQIWGPDITAGVKSVIDACEGCKVLDSIQLSNADLATGALAQKFSAALLKNPDVNAIAVPIDGWFLAGLGQAIAASGRSDDIEVIGAFGSEANFELIRSDGGEDATVAFSAAWDGWAGVDAALRFLAEQTVLPSGVGLQAVDATTNIPAAGAQFAYNPEIDFRAAYRTAWGK
jgi:ABC-type sugar transport system substrate-binding protein